MKPSLANFTTPSDTPNRRWHSFQLHCPQGGGDRPGATQINTSCLAHSKAKGLPHAWRNLSIPN